MAKIFNGKVLFASAMQPTGAQPLDDRVVVQSYSDLVDATTFGDAKYLGMIVGVVDESKLYMLTNTDVTAEGAWKEIGAGGAVSVDTYGEAVALATDENVGQVIYVKTKSSYDSDGEGEGEAVEYDAAPYIVICAGSLQKLAASTASGDIERDVAKLTTKVSSLETKVGNDESGLVKDVADLKTSIEALPESFVTDVKVGESSLVSDGVVDLSNFVQRDGDKVLSTNDYTTEEKEKLAGVAEGAEVNYIKSVGDNLAVSAAGELTVTIPEVEVPFQSVAEGDKVLKLEAGVLSSGLSYARENVDGVDSLVLKGLDGVVIGSVPVADFIADGMLESVAPKEEGSNIFVFTFNSAAGSKSFEVDFSKYVDTYNADGTTLELDSTTNTFKVKDGVFESAGAAAAVKSEIETELADYAKSADVYSKTDADSTFVKSEGYVAYSNTEKTKLAGIAEGAEVNVVKEVDTTGVLGLDETGKLTADLSAYALTTTINGSLANKVDIVEGKSLVDDTLITKLGNIVEIKSVTGDLTLTDGALSVDLSGYVTKEDGKGLSSNDFTNDLLAKLNGIAEGAEVNYVKSVGDNLAVSATGELTVDLSALATSEALNSGLAAKLDASAKVNGVSFVDGVATIDAGDIALEADITRTGESGETETVYGAASSIQSVLANLSQRIDVLDPNVSGELGITSITAGAGVDVQTSGGQATIAVKASTYEGNVAEVKTDGVYVPDMKSYWESI